MAESFLSALAIKVVAKKGEEFVAQVFGTKNEFQAQLANRLRRSSAIEHYWLHHWILQRQLYHCV